MSYDIDLLDPITRNVIEIKDAHFLRGGTYKMGGSTELSLNVTYNYSQFLHQVNLRKLDNYAKEKNLPAYVPEKIGCGLANGDWNKIKDFIEKETDIIIVSL